MNQLRKFNDKISDDLFNKIKNVETSIKDQHSQIELIKEYNQYKILDAMQSSNLSDQHFNWTTGYGYNDIGREKTEEIYAKVFCTEDAIVRPNIVNGTHALSLCLTSILSHGDEMIAVTSKPYDTLDELIGLKGNYKFSLINKGVLYKQIDFLEDGNIDFQNISESINTKTKLIYIQRSTGYGFRNAVDIETIEKVIKLVKKVDPSIICMVDNCYGEFIEEKEPTEVGADVIAGSLIKNPGGGLALTGGYIVGRKKIIEDISYQLTSPGIGKECGLTFGQTRTVLQGLFLAPQTVSEAVKGAVFCSKLFEDEGYEVKPRFNDKRSDIIQAIKLGSKDKIIDFCKGVQASSPVDSFVSPEPWDMPGYDSPVIMAAGAFVQGSSIELSSDAPIKEPYVVYFQGGLTYAHSKLGAIKAFTNIKHL
ncbi:methionine gamma-lyase family protein [Serpentinicella sp. ANB-PHB4]|uniref:methionine gamma-lyase family protein n=1 Tax=Serpentinicella sp. ANB-PHB4 TaxID=3074076 RepID=UPI0028642003|nr:methionine gamma-lyase family protein [Serpentinicella sp. ANB-PHB4]MDR5658152.1 methionine gamma-lyase family protein [Serpentinicella sp. ANB-PHB4]